MACRGGKRNSQRLYAGIEVRQLVGRGTDVEPAHDTFAVDGKGAAQLPAAAALGGTVPDTLIEAHAEGRVDDARAEGVPCAGQAEAPPRVDIALLVDHDVGVPRAADLGDPALRGRGGGVGDGDEADLLGELAGERCEGLEGLLGDCSGRSENQPSCGGWNGGGLDLQGHPQWRRKRTMVGFPFGLGTESSGEDGAVEPILGSGATSLCDGVFRDSISCQKPEDAEPGLVAAVAASCDMLACVDTVRPSSVLHNMREIVTLQLGQLSNYVATHFWNAQESYFTYAGQDQSPVDHDVHWRQGIGADGSETFLPRTVVYDLKGGFGSLRKTNALYDDGADVKAGSIWSGPSAVHKQDPLAMSAYQQSLDAGSAPPQLTTSTVRYWSDFSRVYYHPRSLVQLYDFELNSTIMPFERFEMGAELFRSLDREHDIVDRDWRPFVEECDQMQGMQVFTTIDDAWGGFASSYLEALRDEYPKSCIWVWGLQAPFLDAARDKRQLRLTNTAHSLSRTREQASMVVPLAIPEDSLPSSLSADIRSPWHTSALFAAAAETASLPSRLASRSGLQMTSLADMAESLNTTGNLTVANLKMTVNSREENDGLDIDFSQTGRIRLKATERDPHVFGSVNFFRGSSPAAEADDETEEDTKRPVIGNTVTRSYPHIYANAPEKDSVSLQTRLSTDDSIAARVKALRTQVTWSVGLDDREALSNDLSELAEAYVDDWYSGSDEDDDDL
ncbi:Protein DML1 [Paramyrothecium foliicola]|nr:Protein DML1 [Paramyrothecium foliicola]